MKSPSIVQMLIKMSLFLLLGAFTILGVHNIPIDMNQYLAAIIDKHNALSSTPGERLIVVGGSNTAYGFDSEYLAKLIGKPVINMGLHAYLGLEFMLTDVYPYLHPGDVVLLMPEYLHFFNNYYKGYSYKLAELLDTYPAGIQSMELSQLIGVLDDYTPLLRSKIFRSQSKMEINPLYNRNLFNKYGDINPKIKAVSHAAIRDVPYIKESDKFSIDAVNFLNRFNQKVQLKGVRLILIYPAGRMTNCELTGLLLEILDEQLRRSLDFPILTNPVNSCIDDNYFRDTEYHLGNEGTELRMIMIGSLLIEQGYVSNLSNS
jgi:hypothetical protein